MKKRLRKSICVGLSVMTLVLSICATGNIVVPAGLGTNPETTAGTNSDLPPYGTDDVI